MILKYNVKFAAYACAPNVEWQSMYMQCMDWRGIDPVALHTAGTLATLGFVHNVVIRDESALRLRICNNQNSESSIENRELRIGFTSILGRI